MPPLTWQSFESRECVQRMAPKLLTLARRIRQRVPGRFDPGIDLGTKLAAWTSLVAETLSFKLNDNPDERQFLITDLIPEHGRSGGGLFGAGGELVGVCVGHAELLKGKRMGVFASLDSICLLLADHKLTAAIARSDARQARKTGRTPGRAAAPTVAPRSRVAATFGRRTPRPGAH